MKKTKDDYYSFANIITKLNQIEKELRIELKNISNRTDYLFITKKDESYIQTKFLWVMKLQKVIEEELQTNIYEKQLQLIRNEPKKCNAILQSIQAENEEFIKNLDYFKILQIHTLRNDYYFNWLIKFMKFISETLCWPNSTQDLLVNLQKQASLKK